MNLECFVEDLFLGGQWSIILGYRRLSVKSLLVYCCFFIILWTRHAIPNVKPRDTNRLSPLPKLIIFWALTYSTRSSLVQRQIIPDKICSVTHSKEKEIEFKRQET